jgi:hypothetical protein
MGFFSFVSSFGKKKSEKVGQSIVQILASWDPETASKAELEQMEKRLNTLVQEVAEARQVYKKEQTEADAITGLYNQRLKAAEILQARLADAPDNAEAEKALTELVQLLEEMQPEIEIEAQEAVEAKAFMEELEEVATLSADKLKTAKKNLGKAVQDMKRAKVREERASESAERAAKLAGLREESDQLGSALSAMRKNADDSNAKAEAAQMKAKLLGPSKTEKESTLIAEAMKEASGQPQATDSIANRLAALKK